MIVTVCRIKNPFLNLFILSLCGCGGVRKKVIEACKLKDEEGV